MSTPGWRLGKRPDLDGVRGVAILLVMLAHADLPGFPAGGVAGVTLFFVLSGFLITSLLVEERRQKGRVDVRAFYRRRALRLFPALAALVVAAVAYKVATSGTGYLPSAFAALLYVANWLRAGGADFWPLGHTWSLAIEEQFYVFWPALLLLVRRWRPAFALAVVGAVASTIEKFALWNGAGSADRIYFGTDTRADALLVGCALALWLTAGRRLELRWPAAAAAAALLVVATVSSGEYARFVVAPVLAAAGGALMIAYLVTGERGRFFRAWPLTATGKISYGLYLWNVPVVGVVLPHLDDLPAVARATVLLALTYALALVSYRYVEQPFLRRKDAARSSKVEGPPVRAPVGVPARAS